MSRSASEVEIQGRTLRLSNLDKVLYPDTGFTKGQVVDYYIRIAPVLLPHLQDRPITLKRYPNGVSESFFYEKQCPKHRPEWMRTISVQHSSRLIDYCVIDDLASLVWLANMASLEIHPYLSRTGDFQTPTKVTFDLDPGAPADVIQCAQVALLLKDLFAGLDLQAFPKLSGSKGMQLEVPLNTPASYEQTKPFAKAVAQLLEARHPEAVVSRMEKAVRPGKVFIDWSQNDDSKTTVSVYSLRAKSSPSVSAPVSWDEVERCAGGERLSFTSDEAVSRVEFLGDLSEPVQSLQQQLPQLDGLAR